MLAPASGSMISIFRSEIQRVMFLENSIFSQSLMRSLKM